MMTKQIVKEEVRSNYLAFLHPFLEAEKDRIEELLNPPLEEVEIGKKRKQTDEGREVDISSEEGEQCQHENSEALVSPSKKRKLADLMGTEGRPLWEEVKSRSFAKGTIRELSKSRAQQASIMQQ